MRTRTGVRARLALLLILAPLLIYMAFSSSSSAQDTVTGAFEGTVTNSQTGAVVAGAVAQIINRQTGLTITKRSDSRGRFYQGLLNPGIYTIRVSAPGFQTREVEQRLFITRTGEVVPVPVSLDPITTNAPATSNAATTTTPSPGASPQPTANANSSASTGTQTGIGSGGASSGGAALSVADTDVRAAASSGDASRGGSFTEEEVSTLPLGATTLTRTFDELTLQARQQYISIRRRADRSRGQS